MSFDKAIAHGKEKRKPYRGAKARAISCRNHGGCTFCAYNRMYSQMKKIEALNSQMEEYAKGELINDCICSGRKRDLQDIQNWNH